MATMDFEVARAAKKCLASEISDQPSIDAHCVGLAPVDGNWVIQVNLVSSAPAGAIPQEVDGVDVRVSVFGRESVAA